MPSITTWLRLENAAASAEQLDLDAAREAEARVHDPLWFLFRQWQLGEFQATDAGSPVIVQPRIRSSPVTRIAPVPLVPGQKATGKRFDVRADLLEAHVEAEQRKAGPLASRLDVEAGQELRDSLIDAGFAEVGAALARAFPFAGPVSTDSPDLPGDGASARVDLLVGKVIDGRAVRAALKKASRPSAIVRVSPAPSAAQRKELDVLLDSWLVWYDEWVRSPAREAWDQSWLEYRFSLGIAGNRALTAPGYRSEPSWYSFDAVEGARLGATEKPVERDLPALLPTLVRYPGMAASRFWELEDEEVRLVQLLDRGSLLAASVLDFVMVGGDDWFHLPVALPTGALHTITRLEVQDTFGETHELPALGDYRGERRFALWRLSGSREPALFLPPPSGSRLESPPLERIDLFPDELSNLFWAVEERVEGFAAPLDRSRRWPARSPEAQPTPGRPDVEYRLMQPPSPGYFPLFLEGSGGDEKLVPGQVLRVDGGDATPNARALRDGPILAAVVPAGTSLTRSFQWARRPDGRMTLWIGRSRRAGAPPASPQVGFDLLLPAVRPGPDS